MNYKELMLVDLIGYNPERLVKEVDAQEGFETEEGFIQKSLYIGSVLNLVPSGKYYTLWACDNVTEEEAERDAAWWERLEELLTPLNLFVQNGEDPCDVYIFKYV